MAWHPSPDEIFVFRREGTPPNRVVLLVPGGLPNPFDVHVNGFRYEFDVDATEAASAYVSVDNRKRLTIDADTH